MKRDGARAAPELREMALEEIEAALIESMAREEREEPNPVEDVVVVNPLSEVVKALPGFELDDEV